MALKTDYKNAAWSGKRIYTQKNYSDGTVSLTDVTSYSVKGDTFGADDINATNKAVNGLADSVTGRNYVLDSANEVSMNSNEGTKRLTFNLSETLDNSCLYTLSFDVKTSNGTDVEQIAVGSDSARLPWNTMVVRDSSTTEYTRHVFVLNLSKCTIPVTKIRMSNYTRDTGNSSNTGTLYVKNVKLEKGTLATAWSLSPEEVQGQIDSLNNDVNNIGGRNILRGTGACILGTGKMSDGTWRTSSNTGGSVTTDQIENWSPEAGITRAFKITKNTTSTSIGIAQDGYVYLPAGTYSYSFWIYSEAPTNGFCRLGYVSASEATPDQSFSIPTANQWVKVTQTVTIDAYSNASLGYVYIQQAQSSAYNVWITGMKIERSAVVTSWSPAPEDTNIPVFTPIGLAPYSNRATYNQGGYYQIGKMVYVNLTLNLNVTGWASNNCYCIMSGFPKPSGYAGALSGGDATSFDRLINPLINSSGNLFITTGANAPVKGDVIFITGVYFTA